MLRKLAIILGAACLLPLPALAAQIDVDGLNGTVTADSAVPAEVGKRVGFAGLLGPLVSVTWPDGRVSRMVKLFENPDLLVMQAVGVFGSVDTIYLETGQKRFTAVTVNAAAVADGKPVAVSELRGSLP
jgi:hypothetical protein